MSLTIRKLDMYPRKPVAPLASAPILKVPFPSVPDCVSVVVLAVPLINNLMVEP